MRRVGSWSGLVKKTWAILADAWSPGKPAAGVARAKSELPSKIGRFNKFNARCLKPTFEFFYKIDGFEAARSIARNRRIFPLILALPTSTY
jgi:hypothetical protein